VLPARTQIIGIADDLASTAGDLGQRHVVVLAGVQIARVGVPAPADHELVQVIAVPVEQDLDDLMQSSQRQSRPHLNQPSGRRHHTRQRHGQPMDRLHYQDPCSQTVRREDIIPRRSRVPHPAATITVAPVACQHDP
jgi:hypothetical protein